MTTDSLADIPRRILLTIRAAAKWLGICPRTLHEITYPKGPLPCVRFGHRVQYDIRDLEAYVDDCKDQPKGGE